MEKLRLNYVINYVICFASQLHVQNQLFTEI